MHLTGSEYNKKVEANIMSLITYYYDSVCASIKDSASIGLPYTDVLYFTLKTKKDHVYLLRKQLIFYEVIKLLLKDYSVSHFSITNDNITEYFIRLQPMSDEQVQELIEENPDYFNKNIFNEQELSYPYE